MRARASPVAVVLAVHDPGLAGCGPQPGLFQPPDNLIVHPFYFSTLGGESYFRAQRDQ
jgi:hypothetical protein